MKYIIPIYICVLIFTSCKKDDDLDPLNEEESYTVNRETSAYEEEWYKKSLGEELFEITKVKDSLEEVLANSPNDPDGTQIELNQAITQQVLVSTKLDNLGQAVAFKGVWPVPIGPCPRLPTEFSDFLESSNIDDDFGCDTSEITNIITNQGDEITDISITNDKDESILSSFSSEIIKVDQFEDEVKSHSIKLVDGFSGDATVKVVKKNAENVEIEYETVISFY